MSRGLLAAAAIGSVVACYAQAGRVQAAPSLSSQTAKNQTAPSIAGSPDSPRGLLNQYCVTCHNEKLKTAALTLERADIEHVGNDAGIWEKVVRKVRSGAMPPTGRPRPDKSALDGFVTRLEAELDRHAAAHP